MCSLAMIFTHLDADWDKSIFMEEVVAKKYCESSPRVHHFYTGSCHRKKNINHHQVTAPGLSLWPPWSLRPACRLWKSACRMQYILTRTPEWQAYNCGLKNLIPWKDCFFLWKEAMGPTIDFSFASRPLIIQPICFQQVLALSEGHEAIL